MKKFFILVLFITIPKNSFAACLDGVTTSTTVYSKIRGFYINRAFNGENQEHSVILDKASCTAAQSGDVIIASTTKSHYYLSFKESDKALYSLLLSAQAQGIELEFRISNPFSGSNVNSIAYVISPQHARSQ
ncbi:MAG: hypothetical protein OQJ89_02805 [Kangiellaceae bacterium]|nr:hypothetical protein [Kangiellaceae bacterium]MCW9000921.1 hypothetical protein [Kangiellaceae bacterium]MCW9015875.1 hypothetical protein [Kangiellaceae bacterium]